MTEDPNDLDPSTFFPEPTFRDLRQDTASLGQALATLEGLQSKLAWPDWLNLASVDLARSLTALDRGDQVLRVPKPQAPDWLRPWELSLLQRLLLRLAGFEVRSTYLLFRQRPLAKGDLPESDWRG